MCGCQLDRLNVFNPIMDFNIELDTVGRGPYRFTSLRKQRGCSCYDRGEQLSLLGHNYAGFASFLNSK